MSRLVNEGVKVALRRAVITRRKMCCFDICYFYIVNLDDEERNYRLFQTFASSGL